ncbi:YkgJ family cysteine cluster protein, partial [Escherichia coli]
RVSFYWAEADDAGERFIRKP